MVKLGYQTIAYQFSNIKLPHMNFQIFIYFKPYLHICVTGGLGQLTDGKTGLSNYRTIDGTLPVKGYNWIGWRNDSFDGQPLQIVFKFDSIR